MILSSLTKNFFKSGEVKWRWVGVIEQAERYIKDQRKSQYQQQQSGQAKGSAYRQGDGWNLGDIR